MKKISKKYEQGLNKLARLAKEKGYLTPEDILKIFPGAEDSVQATEELTSEGIALFADDTDYLDKNAFAEEISLYQAPLAKEPTDQESLTRYLKQLGTIKKYTEQEKLELVTSAKNGDEKALPALLEAHQPLVIHLSKKYINRGLPLHDLIQEGNFGLLQAVKKFDPAKKMEFTKFAADLGRQAIKKAIDKYGRTVRIPEQIMGMARKLHRTAAKLAQEQKRTPKLEEVANKAQIPLDQVYEIIKTSSLPLSFETPLSHDRSGRIDSTKQAKLGDYLPVEAEGTWQNILREDERERLLDAITILSPLAQQVLSLHYGLIDEREWTFKDIGAFLNMTEEQVKEIKEQSIDTLQQEQQSGLTPNN